MCMCACANEHVCELVHVCLYATCAFAGMCVSAEGVRKVGEFEKNP